MASAQEVADFMYKLVEQAQGHKKLKAGDLTKAAAEHFGEVDRKTGKEAIRSLIESGRCIYTYFGGSYVELPHAEGAANK